MAVSGTGMQMLGLEISRVAACFSSPKILLDDFASFQPSRSQQSPSKLFFLTLLVPYLYFLL